MRLLPPSYPLSWIAAFLLSSLAPCPDPAWGADLLLINAASGVPAGMTATNTSIGVPDAHGLPVVFGHQATYPTVTLPSPPGDWDLSRLAWISIELAVTGRQGAEVSVRVDDPLGDGTKHCLNGRISLRPGQVQVLRIPLRRKVQVPGLDLFGMVGIPEGINAGSGVIDTSAVTRILIFTDHPHRSVAIRIGRIRAGGTAAVLEDVDLAHFLPFIDSYGQYIHRDWPGKIHGPADFSQARESEAKDLAAHPGPADWDRFGGWGQGPSFPTTGGFTTVSWHGRWWLIDPDGHLFFSQGLDCVRLDEPTPIDGRSTWFRDFPGGEGPFQEFLSTAGTVLKGHYAGLRPRCFDFAQADLKRKYGPSWRSVIRDLVPRRLRSWGINTIGNWSDEHLCREHKTPYVVAIGDAAPRLSGSAGYWGSFPDAFSPAFATSLTRRLAQENGRDGSAGDPWCIGYFVDNELNWGSREYLALATLASVAGQPAKVAFIDDLRRTYQDRIGSLNQVWGTTYASWDALGQDRKPPPAEGGATKDLVAFSRRFSETYFKTCRLAIRTVAPGRLYLGCRFSQWNDEAVGAASLWCDVVSFNLYRTSVAGFSPIATRSGVLPFNKPILVGEFHFGALDRGLFHPGLVEVQDQEARGAAYQRYLDGALTNPLMVGCHWFQYADESAIGRPLDGENYQIGLVDVADTPYAETIRAVRTVASTMYTRRSRP